MADGRHIENRFWQYLNTILANLCKFRNGDLKNKANKAIFEMAALRHLEFAKIAVLVT